MKLTEKVANIVASLEDKFGIPQRKTNLDPLSNLILTVLSQNTNDKNRDQAYHRLKESFPTWDQVMGANVKKIKAAIRPGGLAKQKSERIKNILKWIHQEYGSLNLDNLCTMNPEEAIEKFCQLKGIGVKTISVVLMFSGGYPCPSYLSIVGISSQKCNSGKNVLVNAAPCSRRKILFLSYKPFEAGSYNLFSQKTPV